LIHAACNEIELGPGQEKTVFHVGQADDVACAASDYYRDLAVEQVLRRLTVVGRLLSTPGQTPFCQ
jgi:hypothetical protein